MPARFITPPLDDWGGLGTPTKRWKEGHFAEVLKVGGVQVATVEMLNLGNFKGLWNAADAFPGPAAEPSNNGWYYIVSVSGDTELDGHDNWEIGDWAVSDGEVWLQIKRSTAVTTVNGETGDVVIVTDWGDVTNKPVTFASDWSTLLNKPARFPSDWDTTINKPATFPSDWSTLGSKPSTFASDWSTLANKPATFPSDWSTLANKPSFAAVATTGAYGDLSGRPSLAAVATTGAYGDLSGRPSLATVATTGAYSSLSGRPSLATVATSGSYNDLSDRPTAQDVDLFNYGLLTGGQAVSVSITKKKTVVTFTPPTTGTATVTITSPAGLAEGVEVVLAVKPGSDTGVVSVSGGTGLSVEYAPSSEYSFSTYRSFVIQNSVWLLREKIVNGVIQNVVLLDHSHQGLIQRYSGMLLGGLYAKTTLTKTGDLFDGQTVSITRDGVTKTWEFDVDSTVTSGHIPLTVGTSDPYDLWQVTGTPALVPGQTFTYNGTTYEWYAFGTDPGPETGNSWIEIPDTTFIPATGTLTVVDVPPDESYQSILIGFQGLTYNITFEFNTVLTIGGAYLVDTTSADNDIIAANFASQFLVAVAAVIAASSGYFSASSTGNVATLTNTWATGTLVNSASLGAPTYFTFTGGASDDVLTVESIAEVFRTAFSWPGTGNQFQVLGTDPDFTNISSPIGFMSHNSGDPVSDEDIMAALRSSATTEFGGGVSGSGIAAIIESGILGTEGTAIAFGYPSGLTHIPVSAVDAVPMIQICGENEWIGDFLLINQTGDSVTKDWEIVIRTGYTEDEPPEPILTSVGTATLTSADGEISTIKDFIASSTAIYDAPDTDTYIRVAGGALDVGNRFHVTSRCVTRTS